MKPINPLEMMPREIWDLISTSIACNLPDDYGATDMAMVDLLKRASVDMDTIRKKHKVNQTDDFIRFPMTSSRKRMSTVISNAHGKDAYNKRLLIKGASELITRSCTHYLNA